MANTTPEFSKWRAFFWPIHSYEIKKFVPMLCMFFFVAFVYSVLRGTKDALLVTAPGSGAEAIPFLKFWGVVPAAILFMLLYAKLSNILSKPVLFQVTVAPFLIFFLLFATVLYPAKDILHPVEFADKLQAMLPQGLWGLVATIRNWTYSLFYIMAELWGSVVLSLLFWGFANDITKTQEAKRFYALFGIGANLALAVAGPTMTFIGNMHKTLPAGVDGWQTALNYLMTIVTICGLCTMAIYAWMNKHVLTDPRFYTSKEELNKSKKEKPKMSLADSFKFLTHSKHLLAIAAIVVAYNFSIVLIEITWKSQLKSLYPNPNDYLAFMGQYFTAISVTTIFLILFVSGQILRRLGWGFTAQVTPVVLFITGLGFFGFIFFKDNLAPFLEAWGTTPLALAVLFGAMQNVASKSSKYSLFDPTKEMAYIPLDQESKVKGKAAIDVVGARLGKAGSSFFQQFLIGAFGSIAAITPYVAATLFVTIGIWSYAANYLKHSLAKLTKQEA